MLKNDLLKNDGEIIRIITIKNNQALVIDCIKRNMPYWINIELLESYIPCNDQELLIIFNSCEVLPVTILFIPFASTA